MMIDAAVGTHAVRLNKAEMVESRAIKLVQVPASVPAPDDFRVVTVALPARRKGEILVAVTHLSMDPFVRLRMSSTAFGPSIRPGDIVPGRGLGVVVESGDPHFSAGDMVSGEFGWREAAIVDGGSVVRLDPQVDQAEWHLSLVGPSGLTAYFSIAATEVEAGDTIIIAPGAGSVGSLAAQIAAMRGARVIGVGRGEEQCQAIRALPGFAGAVDCERDVAPQLQNLCRSGADVFIDGVGGALHDSIVPTLRDRARVLLLGFIADYCSAGRPAYGNAMPILFKRARLQGFLLADWEESFAEASGQLLSWAREGRVRPVQTIWDGLERAPEAFAALFGAAPPGKQIVRLRQEARSSASCGR